QDRSGLIEGHALALVGALVDEKVGHGTLLSRCGRIATHSTMGLYLQVTAHTRKTKGVTGFFLEPVGEMLNHFRAAAGITASGSILLSASVAVLLTSSSGSWASRSRSGTASFASGPN